MRLGKKISGLALLSMGLGMLVVAVLRIDYPPASPDIAILCGVSTALAVKANHISMRANGEVKTERGYKKLRSVFVF